MKKAINNPLNWGVLGTARTARKRMIPVFQNTEGNSCLAIASRSLAKAEKVAGEFNIPSFYGSYDELLKDDDIDAVYIPLPNSLHHPWVIQAAEHGKHILCEKPLAYSVKHMEEMIQTCEKNNVLLRECNGYSLHPRYTKLLALLEKRIIGDVKQIQVHFSFPAQEEHRIRFQWELGGGSLLDIGWYGVDVSQLIFKQPIQHADAVFEMEENVDMEFLGLATFQSNSETIIRTSFRQNRRQTLLITGEGGSIFLPDAFLPSESADVYIIISTTQGVETQKVERCNLYRLLVLEFAKQIKLESLKEEVKQYDRYLKNTQVLEQFLQLQKIGGPNGTLKI